MDLHEYQITTALKRDQALDAKDHIITEMVKFAKTEEQTMFIMECLLNLYDLGYGVGRMDCAYENIHFMRTGKHPDDEQT
jgi:hypothetical protein